MATEIFVSYSHRDDKYLLDDFSLGHLKGLQRDGASFWDDRKIQAGLLWEDVVKQKIDAADIVLALVSEMFLASEYCQNTEIANSLKRSRESGLIIFPVIISACSWNQFDWLLQRQFLPRDGRNIEQHFGGPGKRKAIFQQILEALREHVKAVERTKQHKGDDLRALAMIRPGACRRPPAGSPRW